MAEKSEEETDPDIVRAMQGLPLDFAGFASVFEKDIQPALRAREQDRLAAATKAVKGRWYGGAAALTGIAGGLAFKIIPLAMLAGIAGLGIAGVMGGDLRRIGKDAKTLMVLPVAERLGLNFIESPGEQAKIHEFRGAGLLPGWDRGRFEDRLTGTRKGVDFDFFEAHLEQRRTTTDAKGRRQTRWVTVFHGQCLRFDFHKQFLGRTLVARDAGIFNRFGGGAGMKIAKLEDPRFERAFSVYTTDQVESRFLLTPDFMQRLVDLEETFHGGRLRCAFVAGEILIAVEGGDLFEPGSLFTPLDNPERIRELLDDFAAVFHLIDAASASSSQARPDEPSA